jgi:hypothetical protein
MAKQNNLTQEYLKSILDYEPETGIFIWKKRPLNHFKNLRSCHSWNGKYFNTVAGSVDAKGYRTITINGDSYKEHRLAFLYINGWMPKEIDHKNVNGSKTDNRIVNLRAATTVTNMQNRKKQKNNTSGLKCVSWYKPLKKWVSYIKLKNKRKHLGYYNCPAAAHFAYQVAADRYYGEFACFK